MNKLFTEQQIAEMVSRLGSQISREYKGKHLVVVGVLKGAIMFLSDLCRKIDIPMEIDFVRLYSYGSSTTSSGTVKISKDIEANIEGKHVLIVEEIMDSGRTTSFLKKRLEAAKPASIKIVALLDKPARRTVPIEADFVGTKVDNLFLVGYGLDLDENYRNLPEIYHLET